MNNDHIKTYLFPYAKLEVQPLPGNQIDKIYIDPELRDEGTVLIETEGTA